MGHIRNQEQSGRTKGDHLNCHIMWFNEIFWTDIFTYLPDYRQPLKVQPPPQVQVLQSFLKEEPGRHSSSGTNAMWDWSHWLGHASFESCTHSHWSTQHSVCVHLLENMVFYFHKLRKNQPTITFFLHKFLFVAFRTSLISAQNMSLQFPPH